MRIGSNVGIEADGPRTITDIVREVQYIASLGLAGAWWAERPNIDALTAATAAGLAVPGLHLGTAVVTTYPRHPLALASQCLTVQAATGNRLTLGIGPGQKERVEKVLGMNYDRPAQHTREYLNALIPLLKGEVTEYTGEFHHVSGQLRTPGATSPSVLLAALGPAMLRIAGELADGTITVWTGVRTVETHISPRIRAAADGAMKAAPRIVVNLPIAVTHDSSSTRQWIAEHFGATRHVPRYRALFDIEGAGGPEDVAVIGDEHDVEQQLKRFTDAGATEFITVPVGSRQQIDRTLAFLGSLNGHAEHA